MQGSGIFDEPYFQFWPHRYLFPSIIMFLFARYMKIMFDDSGEGKAGLYNYAFLIVVSILAVIWNFDTGIVIFGACTVGLGFDAICSCRVKIHWLRLIIYVLSVPLTVVGFIIIVTWFRAGILFTATFTDAFSHQIMFYQIGFYMMRMPLMHPWVVWALVYFIGLALCAIHLTHVFLKKEPFLPLYGTLLFFSVIGVGLFSYYQGRSHHFVFLSISSTMFYVLALLLDNLDSFFHKNTDEIRQPYQSHFNFFKRKPAAVWLIVVFLLFIQPYGELLNIGRIVNNTNRLISWLRAEYDLTWTSPLADLIENEEELIVLSYSESWVASHLGRINAIGNTSFVEMLTNESKEYLITGLRDNEYLKVLVDNRVFSRYWGYYAQEILISSGKYRIIWGEWGGWLLLEPFSRLTDRSAFDFSIQEMMVLPEESDVVLLNVDFASGESVIPFGYDLVYPSRFSIQMLVYPHTQEVAYAHLIGNHSNFAGFVIQQTGVSNNIYYVGYGDDAQWHVTTPFLLMPYQWNHLHVVFDQGVGIRVYVNTLLVAETELTNETEEPIDIIFNSGVQTMVGEWHYLDRPWNGVISHVLITSY